MMKTVLAAGAAVLFSLTAAAAQEVTLEGRLEAGQECALIHTTDGKIYGVEGNVDSTDYEAKVRVTGTVEKADYCTETKEKIIISTLTKL
ncbi:hypothetical protein [Acuticoccus yangtzensis]|uniref:hypothetical protein n=1 Tax=Acuticoccus yangtzensis TaxID=1443441 RepID=UPI000949A04E|nr:hypothetical protein [Acuticoccus yangtzensis]ORE93702.1 hypothetical protein ATO13_13531 [Stappia sp. 22II-S9-Z10]